MRKMQKQSKNWPGVQYPLKFFYEMEDKIILKFKTKNILNFYETEPCSPRRISKVKTRAWEWKRR